MCKHTYGVALYPPPKVGGFTARSDKSQHSDKQVEHFRYFEKAIDKFKAILEAE